MQLLLLLKRELAAADKELNIIASGAAFGGVFDLLQLNALFGAMASTANGVAS